MQPKKLVYKQGKEILYGYSQASLDWNTKWTKRNFYTTALLGVAVSALVIIFIWLIYYVISRNVVNNIVAHCM